MPVSTMPVIERIARVLAGQHYSLNAQGSDAHAAGAVDAAWPDHVQDALAVLHTLREPDAGMAGVGDVEIWRRMVTAAIEAQPRPTRGAA